MRQVYNIHSVPVIKVYVCFSGLLGNALLGMPQGLPQGLGGLSLGGTALPAVPDNIAGSLGKSQPYMNDSASKLGVNNLAGISSVGNVNPMAIPMAVNSPIVPFSSQAGIANGLPFGWMSMADPEGRVFYFNGLTGQAQWSIPAM